MVLQKAGERRNTCQREHGKHHGYRQSRICTVKTLVIVHAQFAGGILDGADNTEGREIGENVNSLYYYLLVVKAMFISEDECTIANFRSSCGERFALWITVGGILALGLEKM